MNKTFFNQPVKYNLAINDSIQKVATGQEDYYTAGCLLDYNYFKIYQKMIANDLSKQQALNADRKAIQKVNFTKNLDRLASTTMFFIFEEAKEMVLDF